MQRGLGGTFVIPWSQTDIDGQGAAAPGAIRAGAAWRWRGEALRVDGPRDILPLGAALGEAEMRRRAGTAARRRLRAVLPPASGPEPASEDPALPAAAFTVTDGRDAWTVRLIEGACRVPLALFSEGVPPRDCELWVVRHSLPSAPGGAQASASAPLTGLAAGTLLATHSGPRDVAAIRPGDLVLTRDGGARPVAWCATRTVGGARLRAFPDLAPVRLRRGALGGGLPAPGLLVAPDHRLLLRGDRARALFGRDEVLAAARDLVGGAGVGTAAGLREVTLVQIAFARHHIVFAGGAEVESFHASAAALAALDPADRARLLSALPNLGADPGVPARRALSAPEAAILTAA